MLNKDVVHPKMKRRIENPRILLLDCNLEYKKGESQTNIELSKETDFAYVSQCIVRYTPTEARVQLSEVSVVSSIRCCFP